MNSLCKLALLLLVFKNTNQDCLDNKNVKKFDIIPFMLPISTSNGQCQGIVISKNYVLTNARFVNGSAKVSIHIDSRKNPPYEDIDIIPAKMILHESFKRITPTYYLNNLALLNFPSPLNFSALLRPATFSLNDENAESFMGKAGKMLVWKAGYLITVEAVIQKNNLCDEIFGSDFNPSYHFCALISEDTFVTHVDGSGSISHPFIINDNIIGFGIPYPVSNNDGRIYRIMKLPSIVDWIKKFTNINQDAENIDYLYHDVDKCLYQNTDSNSFTNTSISLKLLLQELIQRQLQEVKKELKANIDKIQLDTKEETLSELKSICKDNFTQFEVLFNNLTEQLANNIDGRFKQIKRDIDKRGEDIQNKISDKYSSIQETLSKKEESIVNKVVSKFSEITRLLDEKGAELNSISERLSKLEKQRN